MINNISLDDKDSFYELGRLLKSNFDSLFNLENILSSSYDFVYGYYIDCKLVAFIHINKMYENIDIVNIVVDSMYRRKGIGEELIEYIVNNFEDINSIMLEVNENNIPAVNLYLKLKFYEVNRRLKYYGNDTAIIMKRDV